MPSLKALEEFAASFSKVGGEDEIRVDEHIPPDDHPLPEREPAQPETAAPAPNEPDPADGLPVDGLPGGALPVDELSGDSIPVDDFSFDDFSADEAPAADNPPDNDTNTDDINLDDLFDDLAADAGNTAGAAADDGDDLLNFGDLGDLLGGNTNGFAEDNPPDDESLLADLPDFAEPGDTAASTSAADSAGTDVEAPAEAGDSADAEPADLSDFADLLDSIPDDPGDSDTPPDAPVFEQASDSGVLAADEAPDDFNAPADLLDGLGDNLDITSDSEDGSALDDFPLDFPADETPQDAADSVPEFSLDDMPGFTESDESAGDLAEPLDSVDPFDPGEDFADFADAALEESFPEESVDSVPETDVFEDFPEAEDLSESLGSLEPLDAPESSASLDPDDANEISDSLESSDSNESDADGFDMGGEYVEEALPAETDSFDQFNLSGGEPEPNFDLDQAIDGDAKKADDFSLPGIDELLGSGNSRAADRNAGELLGEPEEIRLNDSEAARLRETLASYPLNLRIACEELIAEEVVAPDLMANLIKLLTSGAPPRETAALAGKILNRGIPIPKGFEKKTGADLETEQASFPYIFVHKFLPVLRNVFAAAMVILSIGYLIWNFVYRPMKAESIYRRGHELIPDGEYGRSRDLFREAFAIHQKKNWFYRYAESYRDERQYIFAEEKYDELLNYTASKNKRGIPEKQAVLDYAAMETDYLRNYPKADTLLRRYILDYSVWDREALLALGDNSLAWGDVEKARYEDAREAYAKLLERYGRTDPVMERMLKYFIRTDNLGEVLPLEDYFMQSEKRVISADTLAELGGYLMDKRTEEIRGVPNEYLEMIDGIRDVLLRAVRQDPLLPEAYYHLARYYRFMNNGGDEELTLSRAVQSFDAARLETPRRVSYRIQALRRYGEIHVLRGEFFRGEEQLVKAAGIYEDGLSRKVIAAAPEYGRVYADLGDLEYFVKEGDAAAALDYYGRAEKNGYAPPEILYRMGGSHYQLGQWPEALDRFTAAAFPQPFNRRILYALGNTSYMRGNYFAAQGYYDRLLELLESDMTRFPLITPSDDPEQQELAERLMVVQNNLGVTLEALTQRTGDNSYRARALGLYSESERAWDVLTRNPESMIRLRPSPDITAPGVNPAYLNVQNSLYPIQGYEPLFFLRIDRDLTEPSTWETIAPPAFSLSEGISGR